MQAQFWGAVTLLAQRASCLALLTATSDERRATSDERRGKREDTRRI
jgi:hypothetical protein